MTEAPYIAILAVAGACWRQVLGVFQRLRSILVVENRIGGEMTSDISAWFRRNARRSPLGDRSYVAFPLFVRPLDKTMEVAWERLPLQPIIYWLNWYSPVLLGGLEATSVHASKGDVQGDNMLVTAPRWVDVERIIIEVLRESDMRRSGSSGRYGVLHIGGISRGAVTESSSQPPRGSPSEPPRGARYLGWQADEIGAPVSADPSAYLALSPELEAVAQEFHRWLKSKNWYKERGIPWRRGLGAYGGPGTGKSSFFRMLSQQAGMPVMVFDLAMMDNNRMREKWEYTLSMAPIMVLFEDFDNVFHGRENITGERGGGLTFDCFLNCLGGIENADGVFVALTTNKVELLDEALGVPGKDGMSTRPGRLDRLIEFKPMNEDQRRRTVARILKDSPQHVDAVVVDTEGMGGAQVVEHCVALALDKFWKEEKL